MSSSFPFRARNIAIVALLAMVFLLAASDPALAQAAQRPTEGFWGFVVRNMAPIMFVSLIAFMLIGYPVSFSLAALGLIFGVLGIWLGLFTPTFLQALPDRVFAIMSNEVLLAIPFFTFMGLILERSRMAEDLLDTMGQLFGPVRGGLAYAVVFVGALMAATTGVVAAAIISMGLISLPIMLRYGYDHRISAGVIMASGTLAQIIPPSLVLIILADVLGVSVGDMYQGALVPGLMLAGMLALFVFFLSLVKPAHVPALPPEARTFQGGYTSLFVMLALVIAVGYGASRLLSAQFPAMQGDNLAIWSGIVAVVFAYVIALANKLLKIGLLSRVAEQVIMVLVPPLTLIFLVLGTIFLGLATPTEGGAMGAVGAVVLAIINGRFNLTMTRQAAEGTLKLAAFVMFILIGARVFALTFYGVEGNIWVRDLLLGLPGGQVGFLLFVSLIVFLLGFFIDFFEIAFILIPLIVAPAQVLGIDLVFLGVLLGMNLQTSFLTPPFGFALFYLRSVAAKEDYVDKVTGKPVKGMATTTIYKGAAPFIGVQVVAVLIIYFFPNLVLHYKGTQVKLDAAETQQRLDQMLAPPGGGGGGMFGGPGMFDDPPPPPAIGAPPQR
jgi:TRAP-type mannitol/chloroaromatic compound transport system permease large subunit